MGHDSKVTCSRWSCSEHVNVRVFYSATGWVRYCGVGVVLLLLQMENEVSVMHIVIYLCCLGLDYIEFRNSHGVRMNSFGRIYYIYS